MELPIFNDNLKSSGTWTTELAREQANWRARHGDLPVGLGFVEGELVRLGEEAEGERLRLAAGLVSGWACEPVARFDQDRLLELNRVLRGLEPGAPLLRTGEPPLLSELHDPAPARLLPRLLDLAFDWFTTEGFAELHPVEQGTVVYLRLLDLSPFPEMLETTALLAAGFHTCRGGFPLLTIDAGEVDSTRYRQALAAAFRMLTQPLVEYFADSLIYSMKQAVKQAGIPAGGER